MMKPDKATTVSPLYGEMPAKYEERKNVDVRILNDPMILYALEEALPVFEEQMVEKGYSSRTINSYISASNRFVDFINLGEVVPDPSRIK